MSINNVISEIKKTIGDVEVDKLNIEYIVEIIKKEKGI